MLRKRTAVGLLGLFLMGIAASPAWAMTKKECKHAIHKAKRNLDKAVKKWGENSKQAEGRRKELDNVKSKCSNYDIEQNKSK